VGSNIYVGWKPTRIKIRYHKNNILYIFSYDVWRAPCHLLPSAWLGIFVTVLHNFLNFLQVPSRVAYWSRTFWLLLRWSRYCTNCATIALDSTAVSGTIPLPSSPSLVYSSYTIDAFFIQSFPFLVLTLSALLRDQVEVPILLFLIGYDTSISIRLSSFLTFDYWSRYVTKEELWLLEAWPLWCYQMIQSWEHYFDILVLILVWINEPHLSFVFYLQSQKCHPARLSSET